MTTKKSLSATKPKPGQKAWVNDIHAFLRASTTASQAMLVCRSRIAGPPA